MLDGNLRIAVFGNDDGVGGAQVAFRRILAFLENEPDLLTAGIALGGRLGESREYKSDTIISRIPPGRATPMKVAATVAAALRLRSFSPDIFISIGLARSSTLLARILPRGIRRIAFDFLGDRDAECPLLVQSLLQFDELVVQALSMRERLLAAGLISRPVSTLPCFPGSDFPDVAKRGVSSNREPLRLAYFGRLADNKGVAELVEALALLRGKPAVTLDIWGDGPETPRIQLSTVRHALESKVLLRGRYPGGREGAVLMASYDAIVAPSQHSEGIPLVLIEAMAVGVPVLCTDVGAVRDACVNNPDFLLVMPDISSLANGIGELHRRIASGSVDHDRLRGYYKKNFAADACAAQWRAYLGLTNVNREAA